VPYPTLMQRWCHLDAKRPEEHRNRRTGTNWQNGPLQDAAGGPPPASTAAV